MYSIEKKNPFALTTCDTLRGHNTRHHSKRKKIVHFIQFFPFSAELQSKLSIWLRCKRWRIHQLSKSQGSAWRQPNQRQLLRRRFGRFHSYRNLYSRSEGRFQSRSGAWTDRHRCQNSNTAATKFTAWPSTAVRLLGPTGRPISCSAKTTTTTATAAATVASTKSAGTTTTATISIRMKPVNNSIITYIERRSPWTSRETYLRLLFI